MRTRTGSWRAAGAAVLALAGCAGGGASNNAGQSGAANAAAPAQAPEEPPPLALDEQRLLETCVPAAERERPVEALSAERRAALNACFNTDMARQLGARLPIRIDSRTELDQVTVEGPALVFRYRVSVRLAELPAGAAEQIEASTRANACAGEDVRQTLALGGVQVYRWVDRDAAPIREVRIDSC